MRRMKNTLGRVGPRQFARYSGLVILVAMSVIASCRRADSAIAPGVPVTLALTSASFQDGRVPKQFTCDGADTSPQLSWAAPPAATRSLALIVDDPDAPSGSFVHWVLFDMPATKRELPVAVPKQDQLDDGSRQGRNDFGKVGYGGPCPPPGRPHRYVFQLYALDATLGLPAGATRKQVADAAKGHVIARGEFTAQYGR